MPFTASLSFSFFQFSSICLVMIQKHIKEESHYDAESIATKRTVHRNSRKSLYMSGIIAAGGGFVVGFDTGAVSGTMILEPFVNRFLQVDATYRSALLVAMMLLTATIGGLWSGSICGEFNMNACFFI